MFDDTDANLILVIMSFSNPFEFELFFLHIHFFKESFSYWLLLRLIFVIVPL